MNSPFEWKDKYSLNIEEIDQQHQSLFRMVNRLWRESMGPVGKRAFLLRVKEILDYAENHFETEEKYFKMYHYPEREAHSIEHDFFLQKIRYFLQDDTSKTVPELLGEVIEFLEGWLIHHLMFVDQKYKKYIRNE